MKPVGVVSPFCSAESFCVQLDLRWGWGEWERVVPVGASRVSVFRCDGAWLAADSVTALRCGVSWGAYGWRSYCDGVWWNVVLVAVM